MSDLGDLKKEVFQPAPVELIRYAAWFLQFIDQDRNADYRDKHWGLLRALLIQHKADWEDDAPGKPIATQELWRLALEERGEDTSDAKGSKARNRVNDHWNDLRSRFYEFEGRFTDAARKAGFTGLLWPEKHQSSGGTSSTYYLAWRKFGEAVTQPALAQSYKELPFVLHYHEDQSSLRFSWIGRLLLLPLLFKHHNATTVRIEGLRRWVPALGLGLLALFVGALVILALIPAASSKLNWSLVIMAATVYWFYLCPLARLYDRKIMMASPLFYPFKSRDCQVELLWDVPTREGTHSSAYNLRLVRYASECPLCGGKVWLEDGGFEYFNRLVGRCSEEPGEHVFSFDRKLRAGYWLRSSR
ncbi:MAG: hypothetical protein WCK63_07545 [Betaproteobacteria bacterium]